MYIRLNNSAMQTNLKNMDGFIEDFKNGIKDIASTTNNINEVWRGNDYNEFKRKMDEFGRELNQVKEAIESYYNFLKGYTKTYNTLETHYSGKTISLK